MYCPNCGSKNEDNSKFCPNCGTKIEDDIEVIEQPSYESNNNINNINSMTSTPVYNSIPNNINTDINTKKSKKIPLLIVIIMMLVIIGLLLVMLLIPKSSSSASSTPKQDNATSRTIMMYVSGNDLESEAQIVSADLRAIDPSKIDLKNVNILLYTGGTKSWHNFISSEENAIYKLTSTGFTKVKTLPKSNMGDYKQLQSFLDYGYDNYKADKYDLILYNHGGAIDGAIYDEFTGDNLSLKELKYGFKTSKFNSKNKLETVLFRTCLNGTLEVANILEPYANYMIASEEVTYGSSRSNVLSFLNNVEVKDTGVTYGKKFIKRYSEQMKELDPYDTITKTYSIVDLSKIKDVDKYLNEFSRELNPKTNYSLIARNRSNVYQYAAPETTAYDMVDLYTLSNSLSTLDVKKSQRLQTSIKDAVVYNWGNNDESKGLSIYFPFKSSDMIKRRFLNIYKELGYNSDYYEFISTFNSIQTSTDYYTYQFNLKDNKTFVKTNKKNKKEFSLKLTDEQVENYARASYLIFKKEDNGYFTPVYGGRDAKLGNDNTLTTNIEDNIFVIKDTEDNTESYVYAVQEKKDGIYSMPVVLQNYGTELSNFNTKSANLFIKVDKNNKSKIVQITPTTNTDEDLVEGITLSLKDFRTIQFPKFQYKILDDNGNYTDNWQGNSTLYLWEVTNKEGLSEKSFNIKRVNLDDDGEYYCVFMIIDIKNNVSYSNLVKIVK